MKKNVLIQILLQLMFLLTLISCSENTTNVPKQVNNLEEILRILRKNMCLYARKFSISLIKKTT